MTSHICRSLPNCASISHLNRLVDIYLNLSIMMRRTLIMTYPRLRKALQNLTQAETTGIPMTIVTHIVTCANICYSCWTTGSSV